jgi:HemK-like putative methylase
LHDIITTEIVAVELPYCDVSVFIDDADDEDEEETEFVAIPKDSVTSFNKQSLHTDPFYITRYIKSIRRTLHKAGHTIVGDRKFIKSSSGLFACLISAQFLDEQDEGQPPSKDEYMKASMTSSAVLSVAKQYVCEKCGDSPTKVRFPVKVSMDEPIKFRKLLEREDALFHLFKQREEALRSKVDITSAECSGFIYANKKEGHDGDYDHSNADVNSPNQFSRVDRYDMLKRTIEPPIEYQMGKTRFHDNDFVVNSNVMIPRMSSAVLVDEAVNGALKTIRTFQDEYDRLRNEIQRNEYFIVDLGTGSGCLLISTIKEILRECDQMLSFANRRHISIKGLGIDISKEAIDVAVSNAVLNEVQDMVEFLHLSIEQFFDLFEDCTALSDERVVYIDLVLCNPPYSSKNERGRLSLRNQVHEPSLALYAPLGPLSVYDAISKRLQMILYPNASNIDYHSNYSVGSGSSAIEEDSSQINISKINRPYSFRLRHEAYVIFEVGHGQSLSVISLFQMRLPCLSLVKVEKDHKGIDRCIIFQYLA